MWLVQLYKARNDAAIQGYIYSANVCDTNYVNPDDYEDELNLCNSWEDATKKGVLILKKKPEEITFGTLRNERFMNYQVSVESSSPINYNVLFSMYNRIFSFEYLENGIFFIDFYIYTGIVVSFQLPSNILSDSNPILSFLNYIKGKTLKIGIINNQTPKYSIVFDDNCRYYYNYVQNFYSNLSYIFVIKNPFMISIEIDHTNPNYFAIQIMVKPKLIEELNDYSIISSTYNSNNDQSLKIDDIIDDYFDSNTKTGKSKNNLDIDDDTDNFSYNLIRVLLGTPKDDIHQNYYFHLNDVSGIPIRAHIGSYVQLAETRLCIYFPLFRPQLDSNGFNRIWPQYEPNDISKYIYYVNYYIRVNSNGSVQISYFIIQYGTSQSNHESCNIARQNLIPSWCCDDCDLTKPFRFVGASNCGAPDDWSDNTRKHNANYLFMIVKPSPSIYNIKGMGCDDLRTSTSIVSGFSANGIINNSINVAVPKGIQRITSTPSGYPIEEISDALDDYQVADDETCFVLFNESLVEDENDFLSIYQAVTAPLSNPIICYIGSDEKIPPTHKNKVIYSDAIVTDLDTNEQMPLVIKYIRYAKRLHKLFNG